MKMQVDAKKSKHFDSLPAAERWTYHEPNIRANKPIPTQPTDIQAMTNIKTK